MDIDTENNDILSPQLIRLEIDECFHESSCFLAFNDSEHDSGLSMSCDSSLLSSKSSVSNAPIDFSEMHKVSLKTITILNYLE